MKWLPLRRVWNVTLTSGIKKRLVTTECTMEQAYSIARHTFKNVASID